MGCIWFISTSQSAYGFKGLALFGLYMRAIIRLLCCTVTRLLCRIACFYGYLWIFLWIFVILFFIVSLDIYGYIFG